MPLFGFKENKCKDKVYSTAEVDAKLTNKAAISHTHDDRYYTETEVDAKLANKSDTSHTHDGRYYTETEVNNLLANKAASNHTHDERYYTETEVNNLLAKKVDTSSRGVLYNNTTGTTGTVTLSESAANFSFLEIFYEKRDSKGNKYCKSVTAHSPNGKKVVLDMNRDSYANGELMQISSKIVTVSGASITVDGAIYVNLTDGTTNALLEDTSVYITCVVGYK